MKIEPTTPTYSNFSNTFQNHWSRKQKKKAQKHKQSSVDLEITDTDTTQLELSTSKHFWYA